MLQEIDVCFCKIYLPIFYIQCKFNNVQQIIDKVPSPEVAASVVATHTSTKILQFLTFERNVFSKLFKTINLFIYLTEILDWTLKKH